MEAKNLKLFKINEAGTKSIMSFHVYLKGELIGGFYGLLRMDANGDKYVCHGGTRIKVNGSDAPWPAHRI
jgi:hypothetical protein